MEIAKPRSSLRVRLVVPAVLIMLVLSLGAVGVGFWAENRIVNTMSEQLLRHMTTSIRDHLGMMMEVPPRLLTRLDRAVARHRIPLDDQRALARELYALLEEEPGVDWLYFANEAGGIVSTGRLDDGTRVFLMTDDFRRGRVREYNASPRGEPTTVRKEDGYFDARSKEWYRTAKETGKLLWTKPYLGSLEPILGVSLSAPVVGEGGKVLGVYGLDLILTRLSEYMKRQRLGKTGRAFLTDQEGYLIAASGGVAPVALDAGGGQQRVHATDARDPLIRKAARYVQAHPEITARSERSAVQYFVFEDREVGRISAAVELFPAAQQGAWLIVSALPDSEILSAVRYAEYLSLAFMALLICGSLAAGLWTVDRVLRPLDALTGAAQEIAHGGWPNVPETARNDEIGVLGRALGNMIRSLRAAHAELEERVAQRTAELKLTIERLKEEMDERVRIAEALQGETSERLQVQAELREKELLLLQQSRLAALGEMIGNIAHQWRQPLNILGLLAQEIPLMHQRGALSAEYLQETVEKMLEMIEHMSRTIDDFRTFTVAEQEKADFRMVEVVEKAVSLLEGSLKAQEITTTVVAEGDPVVHGFRNQFSQALLNILVNARDALVAQTATQRRIDVRIGTAGNKCVVTVADNGGGIAEEIIPKIFDPYFTTKGPQKGTGIGLYMARTIIEKNMGGRISARNTQQGAEFRIEL